MKKNIYFSVFMFIVSLTISNLDYAQSTRKAPYLIYTGINTEMQVLWQLNSTITCTIEWGTDLSYSIGSVQTSQYGSDYQHTYTIPDLTTGTKYYYRVTVNSEIYTGSFYSAPDDNANSLKFFAYGDTRTYPADHDPVAEEMVETYLADESYQTLVILMGDLIANGNAESDWDNQFFDPAYPNIQEMLATLPYQSCMGNHEESGILFSKYFPYPFEAGRYWSFDYGPAHFVVVDQYTSYGPGSAQLNWIESDLASTSKIWKFIYLHEPGWSAAGGHSNDTDVQNYIQPICELYGVAIVFAGHNHYYARAEVNDVIHITTGGGGAPLSTPGSNPNLITATSAHHFCKVEIDNEMLIFTVVKPDGNTIDAFTIENSLPVELVSFTASIKNNQVLLIWVTETEVNNYGFEILRSTQNDNWKKLGFVEGNGNSNSPKDYSFIDNNVNGGTYSYRLKQIDNDGKFEYSKVIEINVGTPIEYELSQNYPNPFNPSTTIRFSIPEKGNVKLMIYNILGETVATLLNEAKEAGVHTISYNAAELKSGVYFYKLESGNFMRVKKMSLVR
jgi:hypothetical protein